MRTLVLALAAALPVWLAAPAAQAVCISGVDCIRERFGSNAMPRNNRIIDRTDRLGDRNTPVNPYVARQGRPVGSVDRREVAPQAPFEEALQTSPSDLRPDARYTPGTTLDPYALGLSGAGTVGSGLGTAPGLTVEPYAPAAAATGEPGSAAAGVAPRPSAGAVRPGRRDPNAPTGAANGFYTGPRSTGALR